MCTLETSVISATDPTDESAHPTQAPQEPWPKTMQRMHTTTLRLYAQAEQRSINGPPARPSKHPNDGPLMKPPQAQITEFGSAAARGQGYPARLPDTQKR